MVANHKNTSLKIKFSLLTLIFLVLFAAFFYKSAEGWTLTDSFYFAVATATTVGYGDLVPTHEISKIFTIAYMIISVGLMLYTIALIAQKRIMLHLEQR